MTAQERLERTLVYLHSVAKPVTIKEILKNIDDPSKSVANLQYVLSNDEAKKLFIVKRAKGGYLYSLSALGHCTQDATKLSESSNLLVYLHSRVFTGSTKWSP